VELLLGLIIMSLALSFAFQAIIETSTNFEVSTRDLQVNQSNLSLLTVIGENIKEAGENIGEPLFPVIEISANSDANAMPGSSKITIRRGVVSALETCAVMPALANGSLIALNGPTVGSTACSLPISFTGSSNAAKARRYRCTQDTPGVDISNLNTDFCGGTVNETALGMVADKAGNYRSFKYTGESNFGTPNVISLTISNLASSRPDATIVYPAKSSIYILQERTYRLDNQGILSVEFDQSGQKLQLLEKIRQFKVAAKVYSDKTNQILDPVDGTAGLPISRRCDSTIPSYICQFNTTKNADLSNKADDWKSLAAIRVSISAAYDSRGRSSSPSAKDLQALEAITEYFPRNVFSR
jgi:hypothetical protein